MEEAIMLLSEKIESYRGMLERLKKFSKPKPKRLDALFDYYYQRMINLEKVRQILMETYFEE